MSRSTQGWFFLFVLLAGGFARAAVTPHIGFVYPAGGLPGSTLTVTVGGQYLKDFSGINLSGESVACRVTEYKRIYDRKEAQKIKKTKETLELRLEEEKNAAVRQQIQRQLELVNQEMNEVREMQRLERLNPALAAKMQFNPQIAERITLEIKLPEKIAPGDYEFRTITTNGLSNPVRFQIGQIPELAEQEANNLPGNAMKLSGLPVLVNGQIMPGDTDCFRFQAVKGQVLVCRAVARELMPYLADAVPGWFQAVLTLSNSNGVEVAYNDDFQQNPDPVIVYNVPESGSYTLSIRDSIFRGREDFVYRLSIGELPFIERIFPLGGAAGRDVKVALYGANLPVRTLQQKTGPDEGLEQIRIRTGGLFSNTRPFAVSEESELLETEPNNQAAQAGAVTPPVVMNGKIGAPGDIDWFAFEGRAGRSETIEVVARRLGSPVDARLTLLNARQEVLATSDDVVDKQVGLVTHQADARIQFTLPETGRYLVKLDDIQHKGGEEFAYRLTIAETRPDFALRVVPSSLRIPKGGTAIATVHAIRSGGFKDEITLSLINAPADIKLQRGVIPSNADSAQVVFSAASNAPDQLVELSLQGVADCEMRTIRRRALPAEDMMQAFIYRHWVVENNLLVQVTDPDPVNMKLVLPKGGVIQARPDSEVVLQASIKREESVKGAIKLTLAEPPEWLTLGSPAVPVQSKVGIKLRISPNAEPGTTATVLLNGSIRIARTPNDPEYSLLDKVMNLRDVSFTIDALQIEIIN